MDDSIGTYENILVALTFLGVLYLVLKELKINLQVSKSEGYGNLSSGALGFNVESDAANVSGYYPRQFGREGYSNGSMEPPVFHTTPYDENELNIVSLEQQSAGVNYGAVTAPNNRVRMNNWQVGSGTTPTFDNEIIPTSGGSGYVNHAAVEGARGYVRQNFTDKLNAAAAGLSVKL